MKDDFTAGFIGCGNMGGVLASVAAKSFGIKFDENGKAVCGGQALAADLSEAKVQALAERFGCTPSNSAEIAESCDLIFLGVKPQVMREACTEIKDILEARNDHFCIVSMAAGGVVGVTFHKIVLQLQFIGIGPIVVALAEGDILAARVWIKVQLIDVEPPGIQVFFQEKGPDKRGETLFKFPDDGSRAVGRGVVADEDLVGEAGLL